MEVLKQTIKKHAQHPEVAYQNMLSFFDFLVKTNESINLTAITDKREAEFKHFIDSLAAVEYISGTVLDIGAGAGFPSIPLAIIKQDCKFMLCDSVGKKTEFLKNVVKKLVLENVQVEKTRVEELNKEIQYDTVLTRGVGALNIICEYALPYLKIGGRFIAYKAQKAEEEIKEAQNALKILGGTIERIVPYQLAYQGETHERNLIIIKKINQTPPHYPRGQNKPRIKPL